CAFTHVKAAANQSRNAGGASLRWRRIDFKPEVAKIAVLHRNEERSDIIDGNDADADLLQISRRRAMVRNDEKSHHREADQKRLTHVALLDVRVSRPPAASAARPAQSPSST